MQLQERFLKTKSLLKQYLPLISQWDKKVITKSPYKHPWIEQVMSFDQEKLISFDAFRLFRILDDPKWIELIEKIQYLSSFEKLNLNNNLVATPGKKKKRHEFTQLKELLQNQSYSNALDFGGGVGNLAFFLEKYYQMQVTVLEKDSILIKRGIQKNKNLKHNVKFVHSEINSTYSLSHDLLKKDLAIGLHTCGHFANDMLRFSLDHKLQNIINFGCCYSKIKNDDYHLCSLSDKSLDFNQRALSCATLSFTSTTKEQYLFRLKIMDYKYSFYHWFFKKYGHFKFLPMSNARRNTYKQSFEQFCFTVLHKYYPELEHPSSKELNDFYKSQRNQDLLRFFRSYYAIARFIAPLLETYLLCDRALYLQENGYQSQILEVFDPKISPRNKVIMATNSFT